MDDQLLERVVYKEDLHSSSLVSPQRMKKFISLHIPSLFPGNPSDPSQGVDKPRSAQCLSGAIPPLETFTSDGLISKEDRRKHFFDCLEPHDLLLCRVRSKRTPLPLYVEAFAHSQKSRLLEDLLIKAYCPLENLPTLVMKELLPGAKVLVYVIEANPSSLLVGINPPDGLNEDLTFGPQRNPSEMDIIYRSTQKALSKKLSYEECLKSSCGFKNPSNVEFLAEELGLSLKGSSHCSTLRNDFQPSEHASSLRARQAHRWAYKYVEAGIKHIKSGNNAEAFQSLNHAIIIDLNNVEGLVARGALYANIGKYAKAVQDFQRALEEDASHKNAKKYIIETLLALGKEQEAKKEDSREILETYTKILSFDPKNISAIQSIGQLKEATDKSKSNEENDHNVTSFLDRTRSSSSSHHTRVSRSDSSSHDDDDSSHSPLKHKLPKPGSPQNDESSRKNDGERILTEEQISQHASFLPNEYTRNLNDSNSYRMRSKSPSSSPYSDRRRYSSSKRRKKERRQSSSECRHSRHRRSSRHKYRERSHSRECSRGRSHSTKRSLVKDLRGLRQDSEQVDRERQEDIRDKGSSREEGRLSPSSILPGHSNLEDIVSFVKQKRQDKMNQLKKNYS